MAVPNANGRGDSSARVLPSNTDPFVPFVERSEEGPQPIRVDLDLLRRWRKQWVNIEVGMELKVSHNINRLRVAILSGNIFRLVCHHGVPMRFLSLDQKPS